MAAAVVNEGVSNSQGDNSTLFQGQKFWFSAAVPQRQWFMERVEANGGKVVPLEKQADILLVDDKRKNPAPGTHSYKYVELSIRNGRLENLDDHMVGGTSRADRRVGSVMMAPKGGRKPFTDEDDQFLHNWVKPLEEAGGAIAGNSIYQQLEAVNPRHTYQAWRDRWLKYVKYQKRDITTQTRTHEEYYVQPTARRKGVQPRVSEGAERSPMRSGVSAQRHTPAQDPNRLRQRSATVIIPPRNQSSDSGGALPTLKSKGKASSKRNIDYEKSGKPTFSDDEYDELFEATPQILATEPERRDSTWRKFAEQRLGLAEKEVGTAKDIGEIGHGKKTRSAEEWRAYFEAVAAPDYDERVEEEMETQTESYVAKGRTVSVRQAGNSNHAASADSPVSDIGRRRGPSSQTESPILSTSQPESPMPSSPTTRHRAPGPNEARRWSADKGTNSQGSINSTDQDPESVEELSQRSTQLQKRKRSVGGDDEDEDNRFLPPFGNQEQAKRRRKATAEPQSLEIPSTPEAQALGRSDDEDEKRNQSQEGESPTPWQRRLPPKHMRQDDTPSPPLFVPQGHSLSLRRWSHEPEEERPGPPFDVEESEILPSTPTRREESSPDPRTSPLSIRLVSDHDPLVASSFSQARSDKEQDNGSPAPEFETAPEFSQAWETAQEEPKPAKWDVRDGTVDETQAGDDLALPEPEGGWDVLPLPLGPGEEEHVLETGDASQSEEAAASQAESIGSWIAAHLEADADADDELLIKAAGIADLNFKLADVVYQYLARNRPVPEDIKGVWTEQDDIALMGNDAEEIRRIEEKHGKEALVGRWQYLENERMYAQ